MSDPKGTEIDKDAVTSEAIVILNIGSCMLTHPLGLDDLDRSCFWTGLEL